MAWIESHIDLGEHPKVYQLCQYLTIDKPEAIGILHLLWHFTMKYAWRDGDLRRFTPSAIASVIGWKKEPEMLITALRECKWLDNKMIVHDWLEYAGKLVRDRRYNEERRKTALNGVNPRKTTATLPNPTQPNQRQLLRRALDERFETFWKAYPKKIGKGAAEKAWQKISSLEAVLETIAGAVAAQSRSEQWLKDGGQFIPHPATWLNQRRWEDEVNREKVVG